MGSRPWLRGSRASRFAFAFVAALALLCAAPAHAEVALVPAHDGHLGAWLVVGPIATQAATAVDLSRAEPRAGAALYAGAPTPPWRTLGTADGALDLRKLLGVSEVAGPHAALGGVLSLDRDLDGWLMLSADGGSAVHVDGQRLWSRDAPRTRGVSWDVIPLRLAKGQHRIVLWLHHRGEHWAAMVRIVDRATLMAPEGATLLLPGTSDAERPLLAKSLLSFAVTPGLGADGYRPFATLAYRRGMPLGHDATSRVIARTSAGAELRQAHLGSLIVGRRGVVPLTVRLPRLNAAALGPSATTRVTFRAEVGGAAREQQLVLSSRAPGAYQRSRDAEARVRSGGSPLIDKEIAAATLQWRREQLQLAGAGTLASERNLMLRVKRVDELSALLEGGKDPLAQTGVFSLAHRSRADGTLQNFRVHVPASYSPGTTARYPLVVALHGYQGRPSGILRAFLDHDGKSSKAGVDGFVVAPAAHRNSFYRGPGELEVLDVLDWVLDTYPIDPDRVSITGVSMGGTGTAHIALHHADRFAAAAPLCGYHSYFLRRDTSKRPIQSWERPLMHHWSPASWSDNARNLPFYVAHGTKDFPLENSRVLVRRFKELGYSMTDEWPDTGHAVWERTYAGAALWPWLTRHRRSPAPARVTLRTDSLRYGTQAWLRVTELESSDHAALVDATIESPSRVRVTTEHARRVQIERTALLSTSDRIALEIYGTALEFAPAEALDVRRGASGWAKTGPDAPRLMKRAGVEGPLRDAFLGPLVFVYGSRDPATFRANREVAQLFARDRDTADVRYPVIADVELTPELEQAASLFMVGTPRDHSVLAKLRGVLPIREQGDQLLVGSELVTGKELGALFIYPNPAQPDRTITVLQAPDVPGLYRALSLPKLLPDYVVYDEGVATASGQQVLGGATLRKAGFFDQNWSLPAQ